MTDSRHLQIIIDAQNNASKELGVVEKSMGSLKTAVFSVVSALSVAGLYTAFKQTIDASNQLNNSLVGLNSVARAFKQDTDQAKRAAISLANDGLMSVNDAASGLKNLLASGFSLPEATNLMRAFKDSAAFNRQGMLEFGQAIEGATQGIKNQNSIMVDNAGITKNLSIILKEAGYSQQDLMLVTSDAGVRMALYNGILKEAATFQGDAARLSEQLSGRQAQLATAFFMLKVRIGDELAPVMSKFIDILSYLISVANKLVDQIEKAGGIVAFFKTKISEALQYINDNTGFIDVLSNAFNNVAVVFREFLLPELQKLWDALQPLMPFLQLLAKVLGVILYGAILILVKLIETGLIIAVTAMSAAIATANGIIKFFAASWDLVTTAISKVIGYIDTLIQKIKQLNILQGAQNAFNSVFGGGKASGGPVRSGTTYMVGEDGPELFTPNMSGVITPNSRISSSGGVVVNITVNGDVSGQELISKIEQSLMNKLMMNTKLAL